MEQAFGADFSGVKVHTDLHADQLNRSIQARAFTTGQDVFFRHGEFSLGSKRGQELLAHELTHVVQQNGNAVQPKSLAKQENQKENKLQSKTKFNQSAEPAAIPEQQAQAPSTHLAPTAAPADTPERQELLQQQALAADGASPEVEVQRQEAGGGTAPTSLEADGEFQEVVSQSQGVAEQKKEHQPPEEKSQEAQDAAEPPSDEVESYAAGRQVSEKMEQAETPPFDAAAFKDALMERIRQITPQNLDEMDEFKDSGKLTSVKNDVTGKVDEAQSDSQGPLEETTEETPNTSGIDAKQVTPLPSNDPGQAPADIGGEKAAPKSKGYGEIEAPLEQSSQELDQQLAEADITEEQLANSNEPQFLATLDSKKQAQTSAAESPKAYRQFEVSKLSQAKSEASTTVQDSLQGMHGGRSQSFEQVTGKQEEGKGKDEEARTKIAGDLQQIYDKTKTSVESILNDLDAEVDREFDAGAADAKQAFEDYVVQKMEAYKEQRYNSWGPIGWLTWIRDQVLGLPDEVNVFYEEGRDLYLQKMDAVLDTIAELVATKLNEAKAEVTNGKEQVEEYVEQLPEDLKEIGEAAAEEIRSQFDQLEQEINSKQDELIDKLANKYKENLDAVDARIKEMQEANKGLLQKAIDATVGVINTIAELAQMLANVLARAASAIPTILKDPIGFINNLVSALKQGFLNFVANIKQHLMQGLMSWLTGTLSSAGIQMPESLDAQGIFGLVVQVLGITYQTIRARAAKRLGEEKVGYLEENFEMFRILATQGMAGLWQVAKDKVGDVKAMVLDPIQNYIIESVIKGGIQWILSLLTPASAFIKACQAIVQIIQFFIENAQQIAALINSIVDAVLAIASGAIDKAVQGVENALATAIPLVIDFFAKLLGLGNIGQKVQDIIQKLRQPVEKSVDWVIEQGVKAAKALDKKFKKSKLGKKVESTKEKARKKKEAAQKLINKKKEAVEKRYEREKNKLLKSKAGKKELDALKKKRDAAKKKLENAKNWPAKKLEAFARKAKATKGAGKDKYRKTREKGKEKSAAVVEWWKARKQFKAKDGETHTLSFKGADRNATLMVASVPNPYTNFLDQLEKNNNLTTDQKTSISEAKKIVKKLDNLKRKRDDDNKQKEIEQILDQLRNETVKLFGANLPDCCSKNQGLTFGPLKYGYGTLMTAKYLTHKNMPQGSTPNPPENSNYESLNKRRIPSKDPKKEDSSYYVKGHLLNDNLGGTGKEWKNLTPLTRKANSQHEVKIESFVKAAVDSGAMVEYQVNAVYSGQGEGPTKDDLKKNRNITDDNDPTLAVLMEVIKAEEKVPTSLECSAKIVNSATKKEETIENKVDRGIDTYTIQGEPKQPIGEQPYETKAIVNVPLRTQPPRSKKQKINLGED